MDPSPAFTSARIAAILNEIGHDWTASSRSSPPSLDSLLLLHISHLLAIIAKSLVHQPPTSPCPCLSNLNSFTSYANPSCPSCHGSGSIPE